MEKMDFNLVNTHSFNVDVAKDYGILEAIFINNLAYWVTLNMRNDTHYYEGRYWVFYTRKALSELFPYASEKQMRRVTDKLTEEGIIVKGNFNALKYDRTLWYSFTDKGIELLVSYGIASRPRGRVHLPEWADANAQAGTPIPNNKLPNDKQPNNKKKHTKKSVPTLEEVRGYLADKGINSFTAEEFYEYFEAGDWTDAKGNPVRNWKQKCLTWSKYKKGGANDSRRGTERCTERPLEDYEEQLYRNAERLEF